jgi:hypothetical protein
MYQRLILTLLFWLALSGGITFGQEAPVLVVSLKDITDHPISGVRVIVRDSAGEHEIAHATSDAQGVASFAALNANDIRVAVEGQLESGARLFQPGNDARGMLVFLRSGTTHVDLLADVDGLVAPDPRTMSALEPGIPMATTSRVFPTASLAARPTVTAIQALPQPTFLALAGRAADAGIPGDAPNQAPPSPASPILAWVGMVVLIGCGIGILVLLRPWWRGR